MTNFQRRCGAIALAVGAMFFVTWLDLFVQRNHHLIGGGLSRTVLLVLINLHIVIIALLLFFIVRNAIKLYYERRNGVPGSLFKRNLLFAFVLFSVIPSFFVFFTAGKFITQNIDRWFKVRLGTGIEQAIKLHEEHTRALRNSLVSQAHELQNWYSEHDDFSRAPIDSADAFYVWDKSGRSVYGKSIYDEIKVWRSFRMCNDQSMKSLKQKFLARCQSVTTIDCFDFYGSLYVFVPMGQHTGILVHRYPPTQRNLLMHVQGVYDDYQQLAFVRKALHVNYFLTFFVVTLLIVFLSVWCAFYLARGMSKPIQTLLKATDEVRKGNWNIHVPVEQTSDLQSLARGFNEMTAAVRQAHNALEKKNKEMIAMTTIKTWQEAAKQMAHEIKNPLTPIQLATQRLQRKYKNALGTDSAFVDCTNTILQQVGVIKDLVTHFTQFASMPSPRIQDVNMRDVVREVICLYELGYPEISFVEACDTFNGTIKTDRQKIKLALVNLIDNSVRALNKYGQTDVQHNITIRLFVDDWFNIVVTDNGPGIPQSVKDTLFQPYVSTEKKNMGLGLAIVRDSVTQLGGSVELVMSGVGTQFHIRLPK